jgi:uncharacterized protein (DUF3084 family)
MTDKPVEQRIREHYQVANGEWLVEKNKVKEARLLKEAVERIEWLAARAARFEKLYDQEIFRRDERVEQRRKELDEREELLRKRENMVKLKIQEAKYALTALERYSD